MASQLVLVVSVSGTCTVYAEYLEYWQHTVVATNQSIDGAGSLRCVVACRCRAWVKERTHKSRSQESTLGNPII